MTTERLTSLIENIVREIMSNRDQVSIEAISLSRSTTISINVNPSEVGRVIGEHGSHFKALEKICLAVSHKYGQHFELLPMEEPDAEVVPMRYGRFHGRDDWPKDQITSLVIQTARTIFRNEDAVEVTVEDKKNFVTVYTIKVARSEDGDIVNVTQSALKPIFNAIGRMNGRVLFVEVIAVKNTGSKPGERQPLTPDGRFCKTVRR